jgi:curved DNA-binding protein CbpA
VLHFGDRRLFKRFACKTDLYVTIDGRRWEASTVDFSLSGLCIFVEGMPAIELNSRVSLSIEEMDLAIQADVVWLQKTESNLLIGLQKITISGLLKHIPLSDILLDLQRSDKTGILEITNAGTCKQIFIKGGTVVSAASNSREDSIEDILLRDSKITSDQYSQFVNSKCETRNSQVRALVEMGYIQPHDLLMTVKRQAEEIILSLFQWADGFVTFIEGPLSPEIAQFKLSAANLIFQGIKRINGPEYFQAVCPILDTILYYSEEPINLFQNILITSEDQYVLSLIDSKVTIKELVAMSAIGELLTMKIISALLSTRMIVPIGKGYIPDKNIVKIFKEPPKEIDSAFISKVKDLFSSLGSLDYYSVLGIRHRASQEEVKKAFYRCAREFHPDKHFGISSETTKVELNAIFAFINNAYKMLSDPAERAKYDNTLSRRAYKPETNNVETAKVKFQEGKALLMRGLYEDAAVLFAQAVHFDRSAAAYHYHLGVAYAKLSKFQDAVQAITKALEIDPQNADYITELGQIYLMLGFSGRAKSTFEKAIKVDPSNRKAHEGLKSAG